MTATRWHHRFNILSTNRHRALLCIACLAAVIGCSSKSGLVAVTGDVAYQGKPLDQGTIVFASPKSRLVTGEIAGGKIVKVTTLKENDGIAAGEYTVAITSLDQSEKYKNSRNPPSLIPIRYADASTSGLKANIDPSKENVLQFSLQGP